jgi:uncharacterized membrane protein
MDQPQDSTKRIKRRELLTYPKLQFTLVALLVGTIFVLSAVFYGVLLYSFNSMVSFGATLPLGFQDTFFDKLNYLQSLSSTVFFVVTFLSILGLGTLMFIISHHISGPIYNIHKSLKEVLKSGQIVKIGLRKRDFFQDFKETYNQVVSKLTK